MTNSQQWSPDYVQRIVRVLETSTRPLLVETGDGLAIVKYMGNRQGDDALICELVGTSLAKLIGLPVADFAVAYLPALDLNVPGRGIEAGPAFYSRWEQAESFSHSSRLLKKLADPAQITRLVAFDTWVQNRDRYDGSGQSEANLDNLLFRLDGPNAGMLVIDHTHAFVETTLADDMNKAWVEETTVHGAFEEFFPLLSSDHIHAALNSISAITEETVLAICQRVPSEWGMTPGLASQMTTCIVQRAQQLENWFPDALLAMGKDRK